MQDRYCEEADLMVQDLSTAYSSVYTNLNQASTHLLSCAVHDLVIRTAEYLPVSWLRRMRRQDIAGSIRAHAVDHGVDDADHAEWSGLVGHN